MEESSIKQATQEINESLQLCIFCMKRIGLSFDPPNTASGYVRQKLMLTLSVLSICYHVFSEIAFIGLTLASSPQVEEIVPLFHTFGYGLLSIAKVSVLWYKKDEFGQLIKELVEIWPVEPLDEEVQEIKEKSLYALRLTSKWYFAMNVAGIWFYNVTPIAVYFYELLWERRSDARVGYVWVSWYPFDKHQPINHFAVYIFEMFAGQTCVWIMIGTDLLFSAMASHICLLLRLLKRRLEAMAAGDPLPPPAHCYRELVDNITLHQRLIKYCDDLEEAFAASNLVNYILSSINICCVVFVIVLLEPFVAVSNKLFLGSALIQIGMICWYGDDILHANADIADAAYNSRWYLTDPKCRRALMFLIKRAQKPIAFTAMKFANISLVTYSSILTRSYSYFALLYTMYSEK